MSATLKTIVIGTSLSEVSDGIVRTGAAIARASGAAVWLLHVYAPTTFPPETGAGDVQLLEQQLEILRDLLAKQAYRTGLADAAGFDPGRLRLVMGSPPRELLAVREGIAGEVISTREPKIERLVCVTAHRLPARSTTLKCVVQLSLSPALVSRSRHTASRARA